MSLNFNTFDNWIYDWIVQFISSTVVWADKGQKNIKPDLPAIVLNKTTMVKSANDYVSPPDDDGFIQILTFRELTLNIQAFGTNSFGVLSEIDALKYNDISQQVLEANGISHVNNFAIQDLSGLNDTLFEERASIDSVFAFGIVYGQNDEIESGLIKKVNIEATYNSSGGNSRISNINIDTTV